MAEYQPEELIPPKEDVEGVGKAVVKMMDEILAFREEDGLGKRCTRFYKMKKNKQWKYENKDLNLLSANLCGAHHKKTVNMLTDNNPDFDIVPDGELGEDAEEMLSLQKHNVDAWWRDTEQQNVFRESVGLGELYGTVGEFGYIDNTIDFPHGDVSVDSLDIMYFSLYPPRCRKNRKAEGFLRWYPMTVREARRKWPESASEISADMSLLEDIDDRRNEEHNRKSGITKVLWSGVQRFLQGEKSRRESDVDELFIIEAWVKDYSEKNGEPVYPGNIRRVMVCNDGKVVLSDDYNPSLNPELPPEVHQESYLYSRWPGTYIQPVPDTESPFGPSDFEQLEKLNMYINKIISQIASFNDKALRLKLVNPKDSGVTNEELNNADGIVRPTNHIVARAIGFVPPPVMGSDIPTAITALKSLFSEIAGSFSDVTQGQKHGTEVVAAKAIALLLETEARMARGKGQSYQEMLRERGRIFLALDQQWRDKPRYVTFQQDGQKVTKGISAEDLRLPVKLGVVSGSTLPVSDIAKREETVAMFERGLIDQEEVLKNMGVDNYRDIIKRMQQGPLGQYLQKLAMIGIPQPILQLFQQLGTMDPKDIERGVQEGKLPQFMQIVQQLMGQQTAPPPDPEIAKAQAEFELKTKELEIEAAKAQAEIQAKNATAQKTMIESELVKQKIETEITDRQVKIAGVEFDITNLKIQKAQAISSIRQQEHAQKIDTVKTTANLHGQKHAEAMEMRKDMGGYDDRKIKSNNKDLDI